MNKKIIDKSILLILAGTILIITMFLLKINIVVIFITLSIYILLSIFSLYRSNNKTKLHISYRDFLIYSVINGDNYIKSLLTEKIYTSAKFKDYDTYFLLDDKCIVLYLKFTPLGYDALINIYKELHSRNITSAIIITAIKDKKVLNLLKYLDIDFKVMNLHPIYRKIKKLDRSEFITIKKTPLFKLSDVINSLLRKQNIKYYLLSSFSMFLLSFFTLYKNYYLVFAIISLLFALISIFYQIFSKSKSYL